MAMTKTTLVVFLSALLVCTHLTRDVEAIKYITNPTMQRNTISCSTKRNPGLCKMIPANTYQRGCETEERCRGETTRAVIVQR